MDIIENIQIIGAQRIISWAPKHSKSGAQRNILLNFFLFFFSFQLEFNLLLKL